MNDEKLEFQVPAIRIFQKESENKAIYLTKIKARDFGTRAQERFTIAYYERIPGKKDIGYQRQLSERSIEKIKEFVLRETPNPLLPTAILANSRNILEFKELHKDIGNLLIRDRLYIIDGQHRFEAWKSMMEDSQLREEWGDYEFPVIILSGFEEHQEIEQFYVINSRQKKIKIDLAQRHLLQLSAHEGTRRIIPESQKWILRATKIVDVLNEQIDNIWKGKIVLPSDSKDLKKTKTITQGSFVSSLKPFFVGKERVFDIEKVENGGTIEEWAEILAKFWKVVASIYPDAIEHFHDYSLLKTVGVFSLHIYLQKEIARTGLSKIDEVLRNAEKVLLDAASKDFSASFWRVRVPQSVKESGKYAGAFSSAVGHSRIAAGIMMGSRIQ